MGRLLRLVLIAAAVLLAQHAAQSHAFSHVARQPGDAGPVASVPLSDQLGPDCLAFHWLGGGLPDAAALPLSAPPLDSFAGLISLCLPRKPRLEFLSRAPPARS